jgi:pimeloyl-ACP methyl ester carboxylesterase
MVSASLCVIGALGLNACASSRPTGPTPPAPAATGAPATAALAAPGAAATPAPPATPPAPPRRQIATSSDGTKISYDVEGTGPALLLVHGGGQTGRSWRERGFVEKLRGQFTVITMDLRGSGESGKPATPGAYTLDRVLDDLTAVADAAKAPRFHFWGFGHGATIGRYLAARSPRVISAVLLSANFGPPLEGVVREAVAGMRAKWLPLVQQQMAGTLKVDALSNSDRAAWDAGVAVSALALGALADYPALEPSAITVPTLWMMGAADTSAMENVKAYEGKLASTKVTLKLLNGATYSDSFGRPDLSLAEALPFLAAAK